VNAVCWLLHYTAIKAVFFALHMDTVTAQWLRLLLIYISLYRNVKLMAAFEESLVFSLRSLVTICFLKKRPKEV
jgi:hypothetical protein